jgi:hypothetical protein
MEVLDMRQVVAVYTLLLMFAVTTWASPAQQDGQAALRKEAKISMRQAQKTALAKEPGTIKSKELEKENGKFIYSFDILTKAGIHEVQVDAINGEVVSDTVESKAAEAKEKQQDAQHRHSQNTQPVPQ